MTAILALARLLDGNFGFPEKRDPSAALNHFLRAAELDNPAAMVAVGSRLLKGEGLQIVEGYAHLVAAAEAGLADVQNKVGLFYLSGRLGIRDATGAAGWFSRSAAGGFPQGAHNLGTLYEQGVGLPRNPVQAGRLYTLAANAGHPQATTALGRLHAKGIGTKQDLPKAWALFSLAVERGDDEAKASLGELTSQLTPPEQVASGRLILAEFKVEAKKPDETEPTKPKAAND